MSAGDDLLDELAAQARGPEADASWERWEALAEGEDDPSLTDPERREALAPLSDATLDRLTDAVMATREPSPDAERVPDVVPIGRRAWPWLAGGLAAAAALALFFARPSPGDDPLAGYVLTVEAGDRAMRGADDQASRPLGPDSRFELVLRPPTRGARPEVSTFLVRDGVREPWAVDVQRAEGGAVRIVGRAEELFGDRSGRWRVEVDLRLGDARESFSTEIELTGR